jgi:hypothetical protein
LLWTAGGTVTRNITAPAQSKIYTVINASSSTQSIVLRGAGPTTGVTIVKGESAVCAWNGSDFIKISNTSGAGVFTTLSVSGVATFSAGTAALPAITTTGDTNTGIFFPAADTIAFAEGGVEAMRIDSSGNVGIGTSSPGAKLEVDRSTTASASATGSTTRANSALSVAASTTTNTRAMFGIDTNTNGWVQVQNTSTNTTASFIINPIGGNVGIGASSPNTNLEISTSVDPILRLNNSTTAVTTGADIGEIQFYTNDASTDGTGIKSFIKTVAGAFGAAQGSADLVFGTAADAVGNASEKMRLDKSGNLGLGVTPSAWDSTYKAIQVGARSMFFGIGSEANMANNAFYSAGYKYVATSAAGLYTIDANVHKWYNAPAGTAGNAITFTQAMTLDASGNLLLGTTTTTNNLRVQQKFAIVHAGSSTYAGMAITGYSGTNSGTRPLLDFQRSRGTTDGSLTKVESGDLIASLIFRGSDGSGFKDAAEISVAIDGATGTDDMPGRITFATSADGSSSPTERARIDSSGNLVVGGTTALGKLTVDPGSSSGTRIDGLYLPKNLTAQANFVAWQQGGNGWRVGIPYNDATYPLAFFYGASTPTASAPGTEFMRIDANGRVGVNTTSEGTNPDRMFIFGAATDKYALHLNMQNGAASGSANTAALRIDGWQGRGVTPYTGISIDISEIDVGSCYGINAKVSGIYSAQYAVYQEISKNLAASTNAYCNYASMATTNSGGTPYFYYGYDQNAAAVKFYVLQNGGIGNYSGNNVNLSDRREKTNFAPAGSYLEKICAIPVQTFNYLNQNMENDPGLTLGVVAQDVQAVAPELVSESNWAEDGKEPKMRLSIYQTDLQYALMKCIQEQQTLINQLTARITALEGA